MSWKTHPIIHRIKQTYGWTAILPEAGYNKSLHIANLQLLPFWKSASFAFKWHRWYLLDITRVWQSGVHIYYVTAFRLPKQRTNPKRKPKIRDSVLSTEDRTKEVKRALSYIKKISLVRSHYKTREPLFSPVIGAVAKSNKLLNKATLSNSLGVSNNFLRTKAERDKWHSLLMGPYNARAFSFAEFSTQQEKLQRLQQSLHFVQTAGVYGAYDFQQEEWDSVRLRKARRLLSLKKIAIAKNIYFKYPQRHKSSIGLPSRILIRHAFIKMNLFLPTRVRPQNFAGYRKLRVFLIRLLFTGLDKEAFFARSLHKIGIQFLNHFLWQKLRARKVKDKLLFFLYAKKKYLKPKPNRYNKYLKKRRIIIRIVSTRNKKRLAKYSKFYLRNTKSQMNRKTLRIYTFWRVRYIKFKAFKRKVVSKFLTVFNWCRKEKRFWRNMIRPYFRVSKKARRQVLRHPRTRVLQDKWYKAWQKKKNQAFRSALARVAAGRRWHLDFPKKSRFLSFSLAWNIYNLNRLEQQKERKFLLSTYRMNFLVKRLLRDVLKIKDYGTAIIRFLQPYRLLLSLRKLRQTARRNWKLARYKRHKPYKRIIPFMAVLVRYWNPQPLLEQIAFELEKTKKHWVILKLIRSIIYALKPKVYSAYRFAIIGRLNSAKRTRKFYIKSGQLPTSSVETRIAFAWAQANARIGSFGVKSWVYITT